jgi:hypothetical protein
MRFLIPGLVLASLLAGIGIATTYTNLSVEPDSGVKALYVQGTATVTSQSKKFVPIPGMRLTLPVRSKGAQFALVT